MAEEEKEDISKKCAQTGTHLKRKRRYYRNGRYFLNKNAFKAFEEKMRKEAEAKAAEAAA
jgi:predicted solute-binding protein